MNADNDAIRILVVDDEEPILNIYKSVLTNEKSRGRHSELEALEAELFGTAVKPFIATNRFDLAFCRNGEEAVETARAALAESSPFAVAFIDVRMYPGRDGVWAAEQIRAFDPDIQIVMVTGYSDIDPQEIARRVPPQEKLLYVQKPFHPYEICQFASALGNKWRAERMLHRAQEHTEALLEERTAALAQANQQLKRDIEERKRLEEQLLRSQKMEIVGRMAGSIAHDFNNMLTAILGHSHLALDSLETGKESVAQEELQGIVSVVEKAREFIRQLLSFSGKQVMELCPLDLNDLVRDMEKILCRIIGDNIDMSCSLAENLKLTRGDRSKLEQVLVNLVANARDAMPGGGRLHIETANATLDESYAREHMGVAPGDFVMLAVTDTGSGMTEEVQSRIFEPFFSTKKGKGTGLGLATSYNVIRQHVGSIWVYSEPGKGSTFKIYLPVDEEQEKERQSKRAEDDAARGTETILLMENEAVIRRLMAKILRDHGYKVVEVGTGDEALEALRNVETRLLIADVNLPHSNGLDLACKARSLRPDLCCLFTSGFSQVRFDDRRLNEENFLQKPFSAQELLQKVRDVLDAQPS